MHSSVKSTRFRRGDCFVPDRRSVSVFPGGVDQILAAVGQQVLLVAVDLHPGVELPRVYVHPVLTLFREGHGQCHNVTRGLVAHIL